MKFYNISFDTIRYQVNPIAPRYIPNEESVNELPKVLIGNLLEQRYSGSVVRAKFFGKRYCRRIAEWVDMKTKNFISSVLYFTSFNFYISIYEHNSSILLVLSFKNESIT